MRKAVLIISLFLLCTIVSAEDYRREAQISFTAGLVANVGFTASPVSKDNYIKPVELSGENSVFEFRGSSNNYNALSTDSFYIYWQIFSPYQLKIYAEIERCFLDMKPMGVLHKKAMDLFRLYMIVGGMPKVVSTYIETRDFDQVDRQKRLILSLYKDGGRCCCNEHILCYTRNC